MRHANTQRNVFPINRPEENGVRIIGTSPKNIELAEDRKMFAKLLDDLGKVDNQIKDLPIPKNANITPPQLP